MNLQHLTRDGKTVLVAEDVAEAMAYIHKNHSFSFDWALQHEGYKLEEVELNRMCDYCGGVKATVMAPC